MIRPEFIVVASQVLFSLKDLLARHYMGRFGFAAEAFLHLWFFWFIALQVVAMTGQLYVLAEVELGKTMALFGATSIAVANVIGYLCSAKSSPSGSTSASPSRCSPSSSSPCLDQARQDYWEENLVHFAPSA